VEDSSVILFHFFSGSNDNDNSNIVSEMLDDQEIEDVIKQRNSRSDELSNLLWNMRGSNMM